MRTAGPRQRLRIINPFIAAVQPKDMIRLVIYMEGYTVYTSKTLMHCQSWRSVAGAGWTTYRVFNSLASVSYRRISLIPIITIHENFGKVLGVYIEVRWQA